MNERKRHVILTAQRLFIQQGFLSTSIQDIIDASGISKGTFYNYFSSKNECLLAILENVREKAFSRRQELSVGKDRSDKDVLSRQIAVRYILNREYNLLPIYEEIFYSKDEDLRKFVKKHHYYELQWLTERIKEVYGVKVNKYAYDCAIMLFGIIQHYLQAWRITSHEDIRLVELIEYALRRLDALVEDVVTKDDLFIDEILLPSESDKNEKLKSMLESKLKEMSDSGEIKTQEYAEFLLEELERKYPRPLILDSIAESLRTLSKELPEDDHIRKALFYLCRYADSLK